VERLEEPVRIIFGTRQCVLVGGVARTWGRRPYKLAKCVGCGSTAFKHSRLQPRPWYCKRCNKRYDHGRPLVQPAWCSEHGTACNDKTVTCSACQKEADTMGARIEYATPQEANYADWEERVRKRLDE